MPLNAFGVDFMLAGYEWTAELCLKDSDGDGLTNGEELGDPCCVWSFQDLPLPGFAAHIASHPGSAAGVSPTAVKREDANCAAVESAGSRGTSPMDDFFLDGEVRHSTELFINNYTVPTKRTQYINFALDFQPPECQDAPCYMVGIEALVGGPLVHHYILNGCERAWDAWRVGNPAGRRMAGCNWWFGGWAPGRDTMVKNPAKAAYIFGGPDSGARQLQGFILEMHYDNPGGVEGFIDRSGIRVHYTTTPRKHGVAPFKVFEISSQPSVQIPAGLARSYIGQVCTISGSTEPVRVVEAGFHAHLLGCEMTLELYRGGKRTAILSENKWHFDDQYIENIEARDLKLYNGDVLVAACVFDSRERTSPTPFFIQTTDEMCWSTISYYPEQYSLSCRQARIFQGILGAEESIHNLLEDHAPAGYDIDSFGGRGEASVAPEQPRKPAWMSILGEGDDPARPVGGGSDIEDTKGASAEDEWSADGVVGAGACGGFTSKKKCKRRANLLGCRFTESKACVADPVAYCKSLASEKKECKAEKKLCAFKKGKKGKKGKADKCKLGKKLAKKLKKKAKKKSA